MENFADRMENYAGSRKKFAGGGLISGGKRIVLWVPDPNQYQKS
jgi:hypothetical protein